MANNLKASNEVVDEGLDAITALFDNGYLRIYDGTQPLTPNTALSGNTLLAELRFGTPAFGASSGGVATANAITQDSSANASSSPTFFRALKADGTSALIDGTVGTSSSDLNINAVPIVAGAVVSATSMTLTFPKS